MIVPLTCGLTFSDLIITVLPLCNPASYQEKLNGTCLWFSVAFLSTIFICATYP